ncbi:MAG TPA: LLM class flavin-dependent oxidoreductase, partial [Pilimelia sp.]|nr:LLM class flavin-dependent oxidoreductase [Pilimelia sp.]
MPASTALKYGFVLPRGDARTAAHLAAAAERAGWDAFFVWEPVWGVDAWVALTAAAMTTERIRLGTMLTPLPRRRPWDLAGQVAALDNLSDGRVILSVGLGAVHDGWLAFEPDPGRRVRAELLDEGLAVLTGLWAGQPFSFTGRHHRVRPTDFMPPPPPVQRPRVPIWVVGGWPAPRSMRRAARWDGWLPHV